MIDKANIKALSDILLIEELLLVFKSAGVLRFRELQALQLVFNQFSNGVNYVTRR